MKQQSKPDFCDDWDITVARTLEEVQKLRPIWQEMQSRNLEPAINADIDRYLSVLEAEKEKMSPHVILISNNDHPAALVIGRIEKHRFDCRVGYKVLYKPELSCLTVVYRGILGELNLPISTMVVHQLLSALRRGEANAVFLSHIKTSSMVYKLARKIPNFLCRGHFPIIQKHWTISTPNNIESFYKGLSKKHRGNLKRHVRKLDSEHPGEVTVVAYHDRNDVDGAIKTACAISSKTYQYGLGKGLKDDVRTGNLMKAAWEKGWLQADVLFIRGEPCAFQFGLKYQGIYHLDQIGYDPAWKRFNVGTVLFLKVLERLCDDPEVNTIDFGSGDADYKQHYGDESWQEALIYLFAPRFHPVCVNMLRSFTTGMYLGANYFADKMGFARWAKRHWRDHLQNKNKPKKGKLGR